MFRVSSVRSFFGPGWQQFPGAPGLELALQVLRQPLVTWDFFKEGSCFRSFPINCCHYR